MPSSAPETITTRISAGCEEMSAPPISRSAATAARATPSTVTIPWRRSRPCANEHRGEGDQQAPAEVHEPELMRGEAERERRVGEDREEAEVVEDGDDRHRAQAAVAERAQRL